MHFDAQHAVAAAAPAIQAEIANGKWLIILRGNVHDSRALRRSFSRAMARMQQKGRKSRPFCA
jgi:hypothetical protein